MLNQGAVSAIPQVALTPGSNPVAPMGKRGEQLAADVVGKYANLVESGLVFIGSTLVAGTIVPVNAASLVSTFTLFNPAASNHNLHLISYDVGIDGTTTAVIGGLFLAYQKAGAALATLTEITSTNALIGGGVSSVAHLYSAATYTGTPTILMSLGISFGTTGANPGPIVAHRDFDGTVIIPPGVSVTVVGNAAQTQAMAQTFIWAELPF